MQFIPKGACAGGKSGLRGFKRALFVLRIAVIDTWDCAVPPDQD